MNYYDHAKYRGLDGVIIVQGNFESPQVRQLALSEFPCVALDYLYDGCDCIWSDNVSGVEKIVHKAAELGHKRIAFIHGEMGTVSEARIDGFKKACTEEGLSVPDEFIVPCYYHEPEKSKQATEVLMRLPDPPTCILYPDDFACLGGLSALEKLGYKVPEEISIVGYDGIPLASLLRPRLTTYCQNFKSIGKTAVAMLIDAIENASEHVFKQVTIEGQVQTGSTLKRSTL